VTRLLDITSARTLRTADDLVDAGLAPDARSLAQVTAAYATAITPAIAALIDRSDPADPIALQFVPMSAELDILPEELPDPIGDKAHEPVEGIVHRYPDRVLLKIVSVCPVYCRFCFRREMVGPDKDGNLTPAELETALAYVRTHPEIREVILTGGDPFMLSARRAEALTRALEAIAHVKVIRWHTRMPVADPERVSDAFVAAIRSRTKAVFVAVHCNHARELTQQARAALGRMADAGIQLLGQSVLLKGVNADIDTLAELMCALVESRVRPYYLHHPDLAQGTSHFRLGVEQGQALVRELRDRVSGLAQPQYVIDIPGGVSKALASPSDVEIAQGQVRLRGRDGQWREH
jgi:lysine 2,3-aminomutase